MILLTLCASEHIFDLTSTASATPERMSAREWLRRCLGRGVAFVPGDAFFPDGGGENAARLCFSDSPESRIAEGVRRTLRSRDAGLGLLKAGRMSRLAAVAGDGVKDPAELRAILEKARAIELAKAAALED